tara:strand:- start:551 stop:910 length:360 start_codon:yes stop_codon:yes gene_type:complete
MAQGDAYVYTWTSYNNNSLTLQPSSGVEWMITSQMSTYASTGNGVTMNVSGTGSIAWMSADSQGSSGANGSYIYAMRAAYGHAPLNIKVVVTNGKPHYYYHYNYSSTLYSKICAIVINE